MYISEIPVPDSLLYYSNKGMGITSKYYRKVGGPDNYCELSMRIPRF